MWLYSIARLFCYARGRMHNVLCMLSRTVLSRAMQLPYRRRAGIINRGACPWAMRGAVLMITSMPSIFALACHDSHGSPVVLALISPMARPKACSRCCCRYFEGAAEEFEDLKPGVLSAELCMALGGLCSTDPPPWLDRMRLLGYPPGYMYVPKPSCE